MNYFQLTARIVSGLLMIYYLIIILDIILSWVRLSSLGRFKSFIHKLTEPYMRHFRGIRWLRFGMLDFSPLLGLLLLGLLLFLTQSLSSGAFPSWYDLVFWIIDKVWGLVAFIVMLFAILALFRLIMLFAARGSRPEWLDRIDRLLFPVVSKFLGVFTRKALSYPIALGIFAVTLIALTFFVERGLDALWQYLKIKLDGL